MEEVTGQKPFITTYTNAFNHLSLLQLVFVHRRTLTKQQGQLLFLFILKLILNIRNLNSRIYHLTIPGVYVQKGHISKIYYSCVVR